ncbi:hypothetical protein LguiA_023760 [Lonicera macranthoides]
MRRGHFLKNSIAFVALVVSISCLLVVMVSVLRLPEISVGKSAMGFIRPKKIKNVSENARIGKFGEMMLQMLPDDLAFTIFIPSEKAFEQDLKLRVNDSLVGEKANDTHAILTRILSFTAVPWMIPSATLPYGKEFIYDSLSGFSLYISKDVDGMVIANGIRSERVDLRKGKIVLHVMDGVIMEAEFEQSVRPYYIGED